MPALRIATLMVACLAGTAAAAPVGKGDWAKTELPVPAKSLVVVQLNGVGAAREKLAGFLDAAVPDLAAKAKQNIDAFLKDHLEGRDLSALTPDGRAYLVLTSFDGVFQGEARAAVLFPTADYKTFREKFLTPDERKTFEDGRGGVNRVESAGRTVYLVHRAASGHVAATTDEEVAELLAGKFEPLTGAKIGETVAPVVVGSDVSVYVNLAEINDRYGDQLRQLRGLFQNLLQQGGGAGLDRRQVEQARVVYEALFQAIEDGTGLALGAEFRPDGLHLRVEAAFGKGTESAKLLAAERPAQLDRLGTLPRGEALYTAGQFSPGLARAVAAFSREFAAGEDEERAVRAIEQYTERLAGAGGWQSAGSGPRGSLVVLTPEDPAKLVSAHQTVLRNLPEAGWYQNVVLKQKPEVRDADQSHRGFELTRAALVLDLEASAGNIPDENLRKATIESMRRLVSDRTTYWFGTDGKRYVQVSGKDWETARKLLDAYLDGKETVGSDVAFQSVLKQLPAEASQVVLADVGRTLGSFGDYMSAIVEALPAFPGLNLGELKPFKGEPTYAGFALVLKPGSVGATVVIPAAAVKTGRTVLGPLFTPKDD
ncbi:MAG TPA: hypothetical protein VM533_22295 [Fimbriiglobus sp.]|jgi:hypothetical protein|nr:hypothetical protein [Fimbriiglobus sp.]